MCEGGFAFYDVVFSNFTKGKLTIYVDFIFLLQPPNALGLIQAWFSSKQLSQRPPACLNSFSPVYFALFNPVSKLSQGPSKISRRI